MALRHVVSRRRTVVAQRDHIERLRARVRDATFYLSRNGP
jgi:hypothetical protein